MNEMILLFCLAAVFLAIFLGRKTGLNTGLYAIALAYIIGNFFLDIPVSKLVGHFSVKILFLLMSVSLFYGYASENGTLEALANRIIYRFRHHTALLPFLLYLVCFGISCFGAAAPVVVSLMGPVCYAISAQTGIAPIVMSALIVWGAGAGGCVPWSSAGAVLCGLISESEYAAYGVRLSLTASLNFFLGGFLCLTVLYLLTGSFRARHLEMVPPKALSQPQRLTLWIMLSALGLLVLPGIIQLFLPNPLTAFLSAHLDLQMLCIIGSIACGLFKLGDGRRILSHHVPWNVILTVCGISMLLGVAADAGAMDLVTGALGSGVSQGMIALGFILIGGFLSFFTGGVTVVIPMLVPIALSVCSVRGGNLALLVSSATLGGLVTAISPFSTGGSLAVSAMPEEALRGKLINQQILVALLGWSVFALLAVTGLFGIWNHHLT